MRNAEWVCDPFAVRVKKAGGKRVARFVLSRPVGFQMVKGRPAAIAEVTRPVRQTTDTLRPFSEISLFECLRKRIKLCLQWP